jgi:hypothetical protein
VADKYIDALDALSTPDDADLVIIQDVSDGDDGTTKKITVAELFSTASAGVPKIDPFFLMGA